MDELAMLREVVKALENYDMYVDLSDPYACPDCGPAVPDAFLAAQQALSNALQDYRDWVRDQGKETQG